MNEKPKVSPNSAALMLTLTPTQISGLKLAKEGNLHSQDGMKWSHLNAAVTYAKNDRFHERPIKVKFINAPIVRYLRESKLIAALDPAVEEELSPHGITLAGKMWLLKHK